ncbi:hypothetical protein [Pontibacter sp. HSC-36F09]|uniref:hypothetical protein n=1 Tax=Pontibacter sp. HSC-36F09 TaxID=2910966 RepID=UPI00209D0537|nr:hypothetical protein [Pontibacter sp. HSC-36F09]
MKKVGKKIKTILNSLIAQTQNRRLCTWLRLYLRSTHHWQVSLAIPASGVCYDAYT